jgi:hypothetical protein
LLRANGLGNLVKTHMSVVSDGLAETVRQWLVRPTPIKIARVTPPALQPVAAASKVQDNTAPALPKSFVSCWLEQLDLLLAQRQSRIAVTESWSIIEQRLKATFLRRQRLSGQGFSKVLVEQCAGKSAEIASLVPRLQSLRRLRNRAEHDRYDPPHHLAVDARDLCLLVVRICRRIDDKSNRIKK